MHEKIKSHALRKQFKNIRSFVFFCTIKRALKAYRPFIAGDSSFVILIAPEGYDPDDYRRPVYDGFVEVRYGGFRQADFGFVVATADQKPEKVKREYEEELRDKKRALLISEKRDNLPVLVELATDAVIDLTPVQPADLIAGAKLFYGLKLTEYEANAILQYPLLKVWAALRPGRSAASILKRLADVETKQSLPASTPTKQHEETPPLSQMYGYGEAKTWGLELAQDLHDWKVGKIGWNDVDRGIVLSGPPGVGKTVFAKALAKQCDVPLLATSLGRWQSTGHLGDLLKAMRLDFADAKKLAPVILFVDELDSFGDRDSFDHDNRSYSIQVVNAFLEHLDGLEGREGVVVIGATNKLEDIDPAILRSGRLDRQVAIPLPNGNDRIHILAQQLDGLIATEEIAALRSRTKGMTGADLTKAVRDARRIARRQHRPLNIDDIDASLPAVLKLDANHRYANAIHEAGHTLVGWRLGTGRYLGTVLADHIVVGGASNVGGQASFDTDPIERRDRRYYLDRIALMLAGMAAEEIMLGQACDGAGLDDGSDLALATRFATIMETQAGMGHTLRFSQVKSVKELEALRRSDPNLRGRIDQVLTEQFARAKLMLKSERAFLERLTGELFKTGKLTAMTVEDLVRQDAGKGDLLLLEAS